VTNKIAIKSNINHAKLLQEQLIEVHQSTTNTFASKFMPAGMTTTIRAEAYAT